MPLKKPDSMTRSRAHEKGVARRMGGAVTPGSGNGHTKADVRVRGKWRVECKTTEKLSYAVTRETWRKVCEQARAAGEDPVLHIQFTTGARVDFELACIAPKLLEGL